MHSDLLGVRQHTLGSCMLELCAEGVFGSPMHGSWKERLREKLNVASNQFKEWMRVHKLHCQFYGFTIGMLHLSTLKSWPFMKLKAVSAEICTGWLYHLHLDLGLHTTEHSKIRATMLWGFVGAYKLFSWPGVFRFNDEQVPHLSSCRKAALHGFDWLTKSACEGNRPLYKVVPKIHNLDRILRNAIDTRRNPTTYWCFSEEDFCGTIAKLANACHHLSMHKRCPERWLLAYFALFDSGDL